MTFTVTGFADEFSGDLLEQLQGVKELGFRHVELRGVWGKNVLQLSDEEAAKVKTMLDEHGCGISSIGSPIGKYKIGDDFEPQRQAMKRAVELAQQWGTKYVRVFSYNIPAGEAPVDYRDEVFSRMRQLAELAEQGGVILVLENDNGGLYGDTDDRILDLVRSVDSPALRLAFDPGNFVFAGVEPFTEAYQKLSPYIEYIHIKDADRTKRMFVAAGEGDGQLPEIIQALQQTSFSGFLSIEPHLQKAYPDAANKERFTIAANALISILDAESAAWN